MSDITNICQRLGCHAKPAYSILITIPLERASRIAVGAIESRPPIKVFSTLQLCITHARAAKAKEIITDDLRKTIWDNFNKAGFIPALKRAQCKPIKLDDPELIEHFKMHAANVTVTGENQ